MQLDTLKCYNWFSGKSANRILQWRSYRRSIASNHLQIVARDWACCPLIPNYLEYDNYRNWPDPWTLISDGNYCNLGRALGMYYTLYYTSYPFRDTMIIEVYKDRENHEYLNLVRCEDGLYTLNYSLGEVVNNLTVLKSAELINSVTHKNLKI
jgi:hypothetical protein